MTVSRFFVCSQCNYESRWSFARCGKCGAHGCCFELKNKRCRAYGGMFDSLVDDHPILEDQCAKCVELYEEQNKTMSSDIHLPGAEMKDWKTPKAITPPSSGLTAPSGTLSGSTSDLSPKIAPEAGPGSDHYTINKITPMEYVKGMGRDEYRGACILNIIKYISRAPYKGTELKDLEKAKWYIEQMIAEQVEWEAKDDKRE